MRVRFALPGALLLLLGSYAIGQEITATISGSVTDASARSARMRVAKKRVPDGLSASRKLSSEGLLSGGFAPKTYC
jgi:hypothetical protein